MMYSFRKIALVFLGAVCASTALSAQEIVSGQMVMADPPQVDNNMQLLDLEASRSLDSVGTVEGDQGGGGISFAV